MITLDKMQKQLDAIEFKVLDVAESQGKLLAALNSMETEFTADFAKLYNGHGLALQKLGDLVDAWNELMKLRPVPRSKKRRSGKRAGER
jgi:hypothetical protein